MLRIGLTASKICLTDANIDRPTGIITATGYGFLEETEKFLTELLERREKQLTPTYFMQGTYNALAGLVALSMKCTGYNNTFVSKGFAFENALQDAMLQLADDPGGNFLVGAFDEAASVQYKTGMRDKYYKSEWVQNLDLFESKTIGTLQGEGAAFFNIATYPSPRTWCQLTDLKMVYSPTDAKELSEELKSFLTVNNITPNAVDVWINGVSGDIERDYLLTNIENSVLQKTPQLRHKHLSGEYCTAVSFALWLGASILKKQFIPDVVKVPTLAFPQVLETVLIINQYMSKNYSFLLLKRH